MKSGLKYMGHILCLFVCLFSQFEVEKLILEISRGAAGLCQKVSRRLRTCMPWCPVPANDHEFPLRTTRPELFPEVHGENGAGTIEDGSQGRHKRCYHH